MQLSSLSELTKKLSLEEEHVAFAEKEENGHVQAFHGLKHFFQLPPEEGSPPLYLFDNHNHALFFRYQHYLRSRSVCHLIHIDQHSDRKENVFQLPNDLLQTDRSTEVFQFVQRHTHVGNFIQPALEVGLISVITPILSEYALEHLVVPEKPYILDIDLDFRAPEMGNQLSFSLPKLQQLREKAECVTIATSPYFLDQNLAIDLMHLYLDKLPHNLLTYHSH
jgi:hypothetical protein